MKKNGFTLVEILTVVVIIAVITTIGSIGINAVKEKINENLWESTISLIEKSAANYGEDNLNHLKNTNTTCEVDGKTKYKCLKVSVQYLIDKNYIKTNEEDKDGNKVLIDNRKSKDEDGYYVNDTHVLIYYEDNAVYAKYMNADVTTNPGDNENEGNGGTDSGNNGNSGEVAYMCDVGIKLADCIKSQYTSQGVNNLYHHNGTLENGLNDGSYRYAGSYETTNNWVCFGTDAETCDDEHLYRIIGVFNEKNVDSGATEQRVKLIKAYEGTKNSLSANQNLNRYPFSDYPYNGKLELIPGYYWSGSNSNTINNWPSSNLNINILNGSYLTTLGSNWSNMISITEWKIGGNIYRLIGQQQPNKVYQSEIENPEADNNGDKIYNAKVGLMYASDYGFAASPINTNEWTMNLMSGYGYETDNVRKNNWLYLGGSVEWIITRVSGGSTMAFTIAVGGFVSNFGVGSDAVTVRPTFYLNSNVAFNGGTGTETNPIRIN